MTKGKLLKRRIKTHNVLFMFIMLIGIFFLISMFIYQTFNDRIVANVNNENIYLSQIDKIYLSLPLEIRNSSSEANIKKMILNNSINELIILQEAKKNNITVNDSEVNNYLELIAMSSGTTVDEIKKELKSLNQSYDFFFEYYKKQLVITKFMNQTVLSNIDVTDSEIKQYYDLYKKSNPNTTLAEVKRELLFKKYEQVAQIYITQLVSKAEVKIYFDLIDTPNPMNNTMNTLDNYENELIILSFEDCLKQKNIILYGKSTSNATMKQKGILGNTTNYIKYFECSDGNTISQRCLDENISGYPTWKINNEYYKGILTLEQISEITKCKI